MPTKRPIRRPEIGVFEPTAAMPRVPISPESLPTIIVSIRFESCSRMPVAATGRAKRRTDVQRLP